MRLVTCSTLEKITIMPKNVAQPIRLIHTNMTEFNNFKVHTVVRATLPCGLQFALDPTCLQFGWKHLIVPWETYVRRHVHSLRESETVLLKQLSIGYLNIAHSQRKKPVPMHMREFMVEDVAHALTRQLGVGMAHVEIRKLLHLNKSDFSTSSAAIISAAKRGLSFILKQIGEGATPRCSWPDEVQMQSFSPDSEEKVRLACEMVYLYFCAKEELEDHKVVWEQWFSVMDIGVAPGLNVQSQ